MPATLTIIHDRRDYGRMGGIQTYLRHGREYMAAIGRRGGLAKRLPTLTEVRQQSAPEAQAQIKEERLPNRLGELKELWELRKQAGGAIVSPGKEPKNGQR